MVGAATWLTGGMFNGFFWMWTGIPIGSRLYNQVAELLFPSHPRVQIEGDVLGHHSLLRAEGAQTDTKKKTYQNHHLGTSKPMENRHGILIP